MEHGHGTRKPIALGETPAQSVFHVAVVGSLHRLPVPQLVRLIDSLTTQFGADTMLCAKVPS